MANNSSVKRHVVQVSEVLVGPPTHNLSMVGNEMCVVTQQDLRKIVDIRMFTFCRMLSNGQLTPVAAAPTDAVNVFGGPATNSLDLLAQETLQEQVELTNNRCVRREVLKVSEIPMAPAVHVPIEVNSEQYVVIQQDIRKEVDIRMLTYTRFLSNNQLSPVTNPVTAPAPISVFGASAPNLPFFVQPPQVPRVTFQTPKTPAKKAKQLCYSASTSTDVLRRNKSCQHCSSSQKLNSSCQTESRLSHPKPNRQKNAGSQAKPITNSTACNTSTSLLLVTKEEETEETEETEEETEEDESTKRVCNQREFTVRQGPFLLHRTCPQEEPCTSRQIGEEDQWRYDSIRGKICAQKMAELRRQREQDSERTPPPPPPRRWLQEGHIWRSSDEMLEQERRQRENR